MATSSIPETTTTFTRRAILAGIPASMIATAALAAPTAPNPGSLDTGQLLTLLLKLRQDYLELKQSHTSRAWPGPTTTAATSCCASIGLPALSQPLGRVEP